MAPTREAPAADDGATQARPDPDDREVAQPVRLAVFAFAESREVDVVVHDERHSEGIEFADDVEVVPPDIGSLSGQPRVGVDDGGHAHDEGADGQATSQAPPASSFWTVMSSMASPLRTLSTP